MKNYRNRFFDISVPVFVPAAVITFFFVALTIIFDQQAEEGFSDFQSLMSENFGLFINIAINYFLFFVLFLALSKFGSVKIGGSDARPAFNKFSWVAMLFSAGMGIGLVYFSVAEPMLNFNNPIREGLSFEQKSDLAMKHTFFHYGFHVWGIYTLLGIALAYFTFNKGVPLSIRSTLRPLFGKVMDSGVGYAIDIVAVLATLFGLATTLGFGAVQFSTGISELSGIANSINLQVISIVGITLIATASILSGLQKGLKYLSNLNILLALVLFLFILIIGSSVYVFSDLADNLSNYFTGFFEMSLFRSEYATDDSWFKAWSMFYWFWWISWSPFVATFIARISKGRTIREMAIYGLIIPSLFSFLWMSVIGENALLMQFDGTVDLAFFITSSDSGSLVVDFMTSGGKLDAPRGQKVFWAFMEGAIAIALLIGGGLTALQSASISTGFPFAVILIFVSISLLKTLRKDDQLKS